MIQENRSFDAYFGKINDFRTQSGLGRDADDLEVLFSNPADDGSTVNNFHLTTSCIYNTTAAWLESHGDMNRFAPSDGNPLLLDGFVHTAGGLAIADGFPDTKGVRSMGFYDGNDLVSPYFLATQFATSDRWYTPAPVQTEAVRLYAMAATSQGFAHPPNSSSATLNATTIFQLLDNAGISWKIYSVNTDPNTGRLITFLNFFQPYGSTKQDHVFPISQYFTDVQNGTLPSFAYIEPAFLSGLDEHPGQGTDIQAGARFMQSIITALMNSSSWKDSIFIETFDEGGGLFDHVGPMIDGQPVQELSGGVAGSQFVGPGKYATDAATQHVPNPDGIPPKDLGPNDSQGNFTRTGFRVPVIIVSPFSRPHFISHTPMDFTAVLKLVEKRFNLPNLTQRDAAQADMSEFFDFSSPNQSPPMPPAQPQNLVCDPTKASGP
jgi:phospholipase C